MRGCGGVRGGAAERYKEKEGLSETDRAPSRTRGMTRTGLFFLGVLGATLAACGGGADDPEQVPPTSSVADIDAWLAEGHYKSWACEDKEHDARSPSPHAVNRICSNDALSAHGDGEYPVDAASVKELYDAVGGKVVGYAVYRHVTAGAGGASWFLYEKVPLTSAAPHDSTGLVAFGTGDSGTAKDICVGCHEAAGSDAMHSGHDFVYTQVK